MKLAGASLVRAIAQPDPSTRFYLFYGPDEASSRAHADRLLAALGAEKFAVPATSIKGDPASLADEAGAMALFGGPRAIWIEPTGDEISDGVAALLDASSVESAVIAIGGALRKTSSLVKLAEGHAAAAAAISYPPEGRDVVRIVTELGRSEGLRIDQDVAARIADECGSNQAIIARELAKYALYLDSSTESPKPLGHDVLEALGAESAEGNVAKIVDCALTGAMQELYEEIDRANLAPNEAIPVVRALQRRLMQVAPLRARIDQGQSADAVMTSMGKALFWKDKPVIARILRTWNAERIAEMVERSAALERAIMLEGEPPLSALGEETAAIARVASRSR